MNLIESMIEVILPDSDAFLKVKETLSRIGIASRKDKKLYQSVHILHKKGHYYLVHFKEIFALDHKETNFSEEDKCRRNTIARLMQEWGLVQLVKPFEETDKFTPINQIKIIPYREKKDWELICKYNIGHKTQVDKSKLPLDCCVDNHV